MVMVKMGMAKYSKEKRDEVERIISEIRPIIDSCKNEYDESFCFYFCELSGFCKQIKPHSSVTKVNSG